MNAQWYHFGLNTDHQMWLIKIIASALVLVGTWFVIRIVSLVLGGVAIASSKVHKKYPEHKRKTLFKIIRSLASYICWPASIFIILGINGIAAEAVVGGAGVMGLILGFGLRDMMSDIVSGVFILLEDHFNIGEVVEVDGFKGEVIDMGIKTTKLKSWDGQVKIISNRVFKQLINWSLSNSIISVDILIDQREDYDAVSKIVNSTIKEKAKFLPNLINIPEVEGIEDVSGTTKKLIIFAECKPNTLYGVRRKLKTYIYNELEKEGIRLPIHRVEHHTK